MASPKTDEAQKTSSSNFPNGSLRVGFYQDMTSTKSSPEKSCSPREMPSPYGQYSNQHHYAGASSSTSSGMYGNFYNPENAGKQVQQASYSKPTNSPASYYDQYKQPLSQESDFNSSMSPSTNPNSPYHSQQSSPYQQQPNSPFQSPASGTTNNSGGTASNISQAPNSPYSQPNSPYQQTQNQQSNNSTNFHQPSSTSPAVTPQHKPAPQVQTPAFNQTPSFPQSAQNVAFNHQQSEQYSATTQPNCSKPADWNKTNANNYNLNTPQTGNNFNIASQQSQSTSQISSQASSQQMSQHLLAADNSFNQNQTTYNKMKSNEPQSSGTPATTPLYGTSKLPEHNTSGYSGLDMVTKNLTNAPKDNSLSVASKPLEGSKYLDLSKQQAAHMNHHLQSNQYQMFDLSNYSKPSSEFDMSKNKALEMFNRSMPKNNLPVSAASCAAGPGFWSNTNKPMETPTSYGSNLADNSKIDLSNKPSVGSLPGNNYLNNATPHQQPSRSTPSSSMDINYKQPLFNNPAAAASSMMDLTAFMRDFRQAEERLSTSFYDKNITPHMFGKNLQQTNSSVALQQMFNNPMTTMAYNREPQNMNLPTYHNRLSSSVQGPMPNANQSNPQVNEAKSKKQRKKKTASPDVVATNTLQGQNPNQMQHHQTHQHSQHQQQLAHQQSFQSYGSLKIPGAAGASSDPSAISLKSVVPGSVSYCA
jgi:hypothetical protein